MLLRLYSEGAGDVEVCAELKLPYKEFQKKEKDDPSFAQLVEFGRLARKAWWLKEGRRAAKHGANSQAFNYWWKFMVNEFGWADKTEMVAANASNMSTDDIKQKIAALQDKIKKVPQAAELKELLNGSHQRESA